jgi:hypothetical protein
MKKTTSAMYLLLLLTVNLHGQWYVKKYNVDKIDFLSREQLDESMKESKTDLLYSGIISLTGAGAFLAGRYLPYEITDESSFIEQLLGEKGMKKVLMATGIGIVAGGAVASIVYLGRIGRIKSVINEYYALGGSLNISPALIMNCNSQSFCAGLSLTYNF